MSFSTFFGVKIHNPDHSSAGRVCICMIQIKLKVPPEWELRKKVMLSEYVIEDLEDVTDTNTKDPESNSEHEPEPPPPLVEPEINKKTGTGSKALTSSNCLLSITPTRSQSAMSSRSKYSIGWIWE